MSRGQLRDLGVSTGAVKHWLASGRLRPLHRGVYALGHARLRREGRWLAAVLACGPGAALSHRSAAALADLLPYTSATIHVTAPRSRHPQPGIRVHRARSLDARDVTSVRGIPTTTVARTALDVAATEPAHRLERLLAQADRLAIYDGRLVLAAARAEGVDPPRSDHAIHLPHRGQTTVDFYLPDARLVIEVDSWRHHRSRTSFEDDRARDLELAAAGYGVVRLTDRQRRQGPERCSPWCDESSRIAAPPRPRAPASTTGRSLRSPLSG